MVACVAGQIQDGSSSSSSSGSGGMGGGDLGPCGIDCSKFVTPPCKTAVCNTGQEDGPINTCVVVSLPKGTSCDDGKYCTTNDVCDNGACVGGGTNDCGMPHDSCSDVICYEDTKTCSITPVNDGTACTPTDPCQVDGVCHVGQCTGSPKDCSFSPLNECNKVACDSATGKCTATPDANKDNNPCILTGDACNVNKTCSAGQCAGGIPKDCSGLNVGCEVGACDSSTGLLQPDGRAGRHRLHRQHPRLPCRRVRCEGRLRRLVGAQRHLVQRPQRLHPVGHVHGRRLRGRAGRGLLPLLPGELRGLPARLDLRR
ncbi:MAG: hypothetical protein QM820_39905 [Minicystis sp.]